MQTTLMQVTAPNPESVGESLHEVVMIRQTKFSLGICTSGNDSCMPELLDLVRTDLLPQGFVLSRIVLIASECSPKILDYAKKVQQIDPRLMILEESKRAGKADAINKIYERCDGEFLIFINGDALPKKGAIGKLLESIAHDKSFGIASGNPFFESKRGVLSRIEQFTWSVHNETSLILNHLDISNHSNDEMMIVRSILLRPLPRGLVNDGAFISVNARKLGYSIKFCNDAKVKIQVPNRITAVIGQRRRIIFGHFQVRRLAGRSPITVESMMLLSPLLALRILVRTLARTPNFIAILPIAVATETLSLIYALVDVTKSTSRHRVWKRYGN